MTFTTAQLGETHNGAMTKTAHGRFCEMCVGVDLSWQVNKLRSPVTNTSRDAEGSDPNRAPDPRAARRAQRAMAILSHTPQPDPVRTQPKSTRVLFRGGFAGLLSLNQFTSPDVSFRAPFSVSNSKRENGEAEGEASATLRNSSVLRAVA